MKRWTVKKSETILGALKRNKQELLMLSAIFFVMAVVITTNHGTALAQSVGFNGDTVGDIEWPWMKFFNSLAEQFTGPLPMVLGILGLAGCAIYCFDFCCFYLPFRSKFYFLRF